MSTRSRLLLLVAAVITCGFLLPARALGGALTPGVHETDRRRRDRDDDDRRIVRYYVCQVKSVDGMVTFEVVPQDEYNDWRKELNESFIDAAKEYVAARREAKKNNEEFNEKKPTKPAYRKMKSFKKEKDAQDYADKLQERWDAALERKREKEEGVDLDKLKDDEKRDKKVMK